MSWLEKIFGSSKIESDDFERMLNAQRAEIKSAVNVDNGHYIDSVEMIKALKREGRKSEAIELLLKSVDSTERGAKSGPVKHFV